MSGIFISYRRGDSINFSQSLAALLGKKFGQKEVFIDITTIQAGQYFPQEIYRALQAADLVLLVIGPYWASITDENQKRRLDNPVDFVRQEVELAFSYNKPVIPLLIQGTKMPELQDLPLTLYPLKTKVPLSLQDINDKDALRSLLIRVRQYYLRFELTRQPRVAYPLLAVMMVFLGVAYFPNLIITVTQVSQKIIGINGFQNTFGYTSFFAFCLALLRTIQYKQWLWLSVEVGSLLLIFGLANFFTFVIPVATTWGSALFSIFIIPLLFFSFAGPALTLRYQLARLPAMRDTDSITSSPWDGTE